MVQTARLVLRAGSRPVSVEQIIFIIRHRLHPSSCWGYRCTWRRLELPVANPLPYLWKWSSHLQHSCSGHSATFATKSSGVFLRFTRRGHFSRFTNWNKKTCLLTSLNLVLICMFCGYSGIIVSGALCVYQFKEYVRTMSVSCNSHITFILIIINTTHYYYNIVITHY